MTLNFQRLNSQKLRYAFTDLFTREAFILLIYMAVSASVLNIFMQSRSFREGIAPFTFSKMLEGSAERPYVYRRLVPIIANYAASLVSPEEQVAFVEHHLDEYLVKKLYFGKSRELLGYDGKPIDDWSPGYAIKYTAVYYILFVSLVSTLYCLRTLTRTASPNKHPLTPFVPAVFILLLPLSFNYGNYYYDFVELFFLSVLLLTAIKGYYVFWLLLLPLAVLNKESNILVPLLYAPIIIGNSLNWRYGSLIAIGFAVSIGVYLFIQQKYSQNTGSSLVWQLEPNIEFLLTPKNYFLWSDFYAPMIPFPRGFNIFLLAVLAKLVFWQWREKLSFTKGLFIVALFINFPLFILFGTLDEMRNLSFLFLPTYLLSVHTLLTPGVDRMSAGSHKP